MTIRRFVSFALGLFVVVAVVTLMRQANPAEEFPAAPVSVAGVGTTVAPEATVGIPATVEVPSAPPPQSAAGDPVTEPREEPTPAPVKQSPAPATPAEPPPVLTEPTEPDSRVVVTYFHGDVRCVTCRKIESYAQEAVENGFPEDVRRGTLVFQAINVERAENRHYIQDYQLVTRTVVVALEQEGAVQEWVNLQDVWNFVGNREVYFDYVQGAVSDFLSLRKS